MKPLIILLLGLLLFLQYQLWSPSGGLLETWQLKRSIAALNSESTLRQHKNTVLAAEVQDLKHGNEAIEEHARMELGMVKKNEIFYQIINQ